MRKTPILLAVLLSALATAPGSAAEATFISRNNFDLTKVLAPPPAPSSAQQQMDLILAEALLQDAAFLEEFAAARTELRTALGL